MEIASHHEHQTWLFIKLSTSAANVIESKHTNNKIGEVDYKTTQSATKLNKESISIIITEKNPVVLLSMLHHPNRFLHLPFYQIVEKELR